MLFVIREIGVEGGWMGWGRGEKVVKVNPSLCVF
jgi:hypothetical protein